MERIIWRHQSARVFYVFDKKRIVHFSTDGVSIHGASSWYHDAETRLSPFDAPHVYLKALPLEFYKDAVFEQRLPLQITLESTNLGSVKQTSTYVHGERETGSHKRRIVRQETKLWIRGDHVAFRFRIVAGPVDRTTVLGPLRDEDRRAKNYRFEFAFPRDIIPELLDLTESERRRFNGLDLFTLGSRRY